ncbi:hypothetical protein PWT90_05571 [Aphanocladium album]|nr:hypothetical protein PWT90_05571 [Aphanocladium album]
MSCSCNASALRLFARGLVQVHRLEPSAPLALSLREASSVHIGGILSSQRRSLHASRALGDAENSAQTTPAPETQSSSAESNQPNETCSSTQSGSGNSTGRTKTHEECMTEARGKAAWRFKKQGFDWKSFRSKDPAVREKADYSNFDWKNWKGKKHGGQGKKDNAGLKELVDNLEAARLQDRAAVGIAQGEGDARNHSYKKHRADSSTRAAKARPDETTTRSDALPPRKKEDWMIQKDFLKNKYPEGWKPNKRLSPDALAGIRALNAQFPDVYTTKTLGEKFAMSPEAIRRILKSKWTPSADEDEDRQERWHRRGMSVWQRKAELGIKPPKRWRDEGIAREPEYHERKVEARARRDDAVRAERAEYMKSFAKGAASTTATAHTTRDGSHKATKKYSRPRELEQLPATEDKPWWGNKIKETKQEPSEVKAPTSEPPEELLEQALVAGRRN